MNGSQRARQAALRIANGREEPGDRDLVLGHCTCLFCCERNVVLQQPESAEGSSDPFPHLRGWVG